MRVVSICPSNTELLFFLGIREEVAGLDNHSDWPEEWRHLPRVGPDLQINIEKVKQLSPDLVIASLSVPGMERNIEVLKRENLPTLVLNPKTFADIADDFRTLGEALGKKTEGETAAERFLAEIDRIRRHVPQGKRPTRLYWEWWPKPVFTPGKKNWLTEVSRLAGGVNVFEDEDAESVQTDWAGVKNRRPDLALIVWTGIDIRRIKKELITTRPDWQGETFAHPENVHILPEGWYCRPSPRLLTGIKHLAHLLHPERFAPPPPDDPYADTFLNP
jgi:iron complex transport system substrate-binding protein